MRLRGLSQGVSQRSLPTNSLFLHYASCHSFHAFIDWKREWQILRGSTSQGYHSWLPDHDRQIGSLTKRRIAFPLSLWTQPVNFRLFVTDLGKRFFSEAISFVEYALGHNVDLPFVLSKLACALDKALNSCCQCLNLKSMAASLLVS